MVTPLVRKNVIFGIFANPSQGKTLLMTELGRQYQKKGFRIFANYNVSYPHVLIDSFDGIKNIALYPKHERKLLLFEDFERWVNSRLASTKQNITMGSITMDMGKNNCSLIFTSKRSSIIDINVRDITNFFIEVELILPFRMNSDNPEYNRLINLLWADDLEKLWVKIKIYDSDLKKIGVKYLVNLADIGRLYNTQEIVPELNFSQS